MKKRLLTMLLVGSTFIVSAQKSGTNQKAPALINLDQQQSTQDSRALLQNELSLANTDDMQLLKSESDQSGFTHQKFQHLYKGVKVFGSQYTVHTKGGQASHMSGRFTKIEEEVDMNAALTSDMALARAKSFVPAKEYAWETANDAHRTKKPEGELVILTRDNTGKKARLAYQFEIVSMKPFQRQAVFIDAITGESLLQYSKIHFADAVGTAATRYSGSQTINTDSNGGGYRLRDVSRGGGVYSWDATTASSVNNTTGLPIGSSDYTDSNNNWTSAEFDNTDKDDAGLEAHFAAAATYDFFSTTFGRNSYDGSGATINSFVNTDIEGVYGYPTGYNDNAFWTGSGMVYGKGRSLDPLTTVDIAGHEIGHAFTEFTANLVYASESGAMNESFSDIWGTCVENYTNVTYGTNKDLWNLGTEIGQTFRSMSNPNAHNQPDTYGGTYWVSQNCTPSSNNDYCGVHTNSGVGNHWFYILTVGKAGTNDNSDSYNVSGIGIDKAAAISWRTESVYLSANSDYADMRTYAIQSAKDLYGAGGAEEIAVTNAWYAVGVGAEYVSVCSLAAPGSFSASSVSDNGFTLNWNTVSGAASYNVTVGGSTSTVSGTSYVASGLNVGTQYACSVVANCSSGGSGSASNINVTTTGTPPLNYCSSNGNSVADEYIGRVQIGTINNATSGSAGGYADYTSLSTDLVAGNSTSITITPTWTGTLYNEGYAVWIDYNQNGVFTDSGEQVFSQAASQTTPVSGSFTVSSSASGSTRIRVSMKYNGIPTSCEAFSYGEVEDYTVNITTSGPDTQAPTVPTGLVASNVAETTLTLNWNASTDNVGVTGYNVYQGASNLGTVTGTSANITGLTASTNYTFSVTALDAASNESSASSALNVTTATPPDTQAPTAPSSLAASNVTETTVDLSWTGSTDNVGVTGYNIYQGASNIGTVAGTSANITGLIGSTSYAFTVRAIDAASNESAASNSVNVTTSAPPAGCSGGISSFPYSEGFESGTGAWSQSTADNINWTVDANGTPSGSTGPSSATEGSNYLYIESSGNGTGYPNKVAIINSPCINLSSVANAAFTFDYHMYGSTMGSLSFEASTDGSNWTSLWSLSGNQGNAWSSANIDLGPYVGGTVELRYVGTTSTSYRSDMAIDNLQITDGSTPSCNDISLTLTFDNYPEETSWSITDGGGSTVASGGTYASEPDGSTKIEAACLADGCYTFTINDAYGDGICCTYGNGSYALRDASNTLLASGGSFTSSQATNFCLGGSTFGLASRTAVEEFVPTTIQRLYPNPVNDFMFVNAPENTKSLSVYTTSGKRIDNVRVNDQGVDVSNLEAGIYILQIETEKAFLTNKFIKN